jgi:hypothetical protein
MSPSSANNMLPQQHTTAEDLSLSLPEPKSLPSPLISDRHPSVAILSYMEHEAHARVEKEQKKTSE